MLATSKLDLDISQLQAADRLFHLLRHRNKNQHRHSKWWKWVSMLKRCVSNLIREVQARDTLRAQARVQHMNQVLLPRCHTSFNQLIQDIHFSPIGLALVAELSRLRRSLSSFSNQAEDGTAEGGINPAMGHADNTDDSPLRLSEDVGKAIRRYTLSNPADFETRSNPTFDVLERLGCVTSAEKDFKEKKGAGSDATRSTKVEIRLPRLEAGSVIAHSKPDTLSASIRRQRQRKPANAIDDLFQGMS